MASWTKKVGYPVLHVNAVENKGEGSGSLSVQQVRFLSSAPVKPEDDDSIYNIPLSVIAAPSDQKSNVVCRCARSMLSVTTPDLREHVQVETIGVLSNRTDTVEVKLPAEYVLWMIVVDVERNTY